MKATQIQAIHPSGFTVTLTLEDGDNLREQCSSLVKRGYLPIAGEGGKPPPICSRHGVKMVKRMKAGDTWYSHRVVDEDGGVYYCRGYPAKLGRGGAVLSDEWLADL